jgi:hypothetical protein
MGKIPHIDQEILYKQNIPGIQERPPKLSVCVDNDIFRKLGRSLLTRKKSPKYFSPCNFIPSTLRSISRKVALCGVVAKCANLYLCNKKNCPITVEEVPAGTPFTVCTGKLTYIHRI